MQQRLVFVAVLLCHLCAQGVLTADDKAGKPTPTPSPPNPVIVITNVTVPTTEVPITDSTTTSTEKPTTEPTTTEEPTDPTTTPATTTVKTTPPSPPTPPRPAPTPAPTPTPKPVPFPDNVGNWNVTTGNINHTVTCIILSGALRLSISGVNKSIDVPTTAIPTGSCTNTTQEITLTWNDNDFVTPNFLTFRFEANYTKSLNGGLGLGISPNHYAISDVTGEVNYFVGNKTEKTGISMHGINAYQVPLNKSYKCMSNEMLENEHETNGVKLELARLKIEAFRSTNGSLSSAVECSSDGYVADIVPIAVGASLAGLVAIVLVAYLIGRRRSRARGYQSV